MFCKILVHSIGEKSRSELKIKILLFYVASSRQGIMRFNNGRRIVHFSCNSKIIVMFIKEFIQEKF